MNLQNPFRREIILVSPLSTEQLISRLKHTTRKQKAFSLPFSFKDHVYFQGEVYEDRFEIERIQQRPVLMKGKITTEQGRSQIQVELTINIRDMMFLLLLYALVLILMAKALSDKNMVGLLVTLLLFTFCTGLGYAFFRWEVSTAVKLLKQVLKATEV